MSALSRQNLGIPLSLLRNAAIACDLWPYIFSLSKPKSPGISPLFACNVFQIVEGYTQILHQSQVRQSFKNIRLSEKTGVVYQQFE